MLPFLKEFAYFTLGYLGLPFARRQLRESNISLGRTLEKAKHGIEDFSYEARTAPYIVPIIFLSMLIAVLAPLQPRTVDWAAYGLDILAHWWLLVRIAVGTVLCSVFIWITYSLRRSDELKAYRERDRKVAGPCEPDGAPHNAAVFLRGATPFDRENFLNEFRSVPKEAKEAVLVLRQTRRPSWFRGAPFTYDSVRRQLAARIEALEKARKKAEKEGKSLNEPAVIWVCFVTKHNTVEAYQRYARFEADIVECGNQSYVDLLNDGNIDSFRKRLNDLIAANRSACVLGTGAVRALGNNFLPVKLSDAERLSRKEALTWLVNKNESEAMLVTDQRKRLGMTTLCSLVEQIEGDLMPDKQTVARIDARIEEIRSRVRELEENDPIATPPPSTSDDEPAYDTQLPGAGADGR